MIDLRDTRFPSETDIAVIGAGAAGIAAGRRLLAAKADFVVLEARSRLGGRAWTVQASGFPLDLGCGWLHSADRNPWTQIAEAEGLHIDRTMPPWGKPALEYGFSAEDQHNFQRTVAKFYQRLDEAAEENRDRSLADFLEAGNKWNPRLNAISTYINGVELDRASVCDFAAYEDTGENWRIVEGYGAAISKHGENLPVVFDCPVKSIDHSSKRLQIKTAEGMLSVHAVIVTIPTQLIADETIRFTPTLPDKIDAALELPLGLADKAFLLLDDEEKFPVDSRLFGKVHSLGAASYHLRPFGRPVIEAYFGGKLARELESTGERAMADFARNELIELVGNDLRPKLKLLNEFHWSRDPFSRGSYSYALPGRSDARAKLAAAVDNRLFFAGEACSLGNFTTAHGAYESGVAAADQVIAALKLSTRDRHR